MYGNDRIMSKDDNKTQALNIITFSTLSDQKILRTIIKTTHQNS